MRNERFLPGVDPPAFVQPADIQGIEPELVVEVGDERLGFGVVARQGQRPAVGVAFGVTVSGHVGRVDHAEGAHHPALGQVCL